MADFSKRPVSVTCYLCGRGYGTASLAIHVPQCQAKFLAEQEKLPKAQRRPLPPAPTTLGAASGSAADADKWNEAAFKSYTEHGLVGCEHCGRKFASDRLAIHQRSCTADNPARRVGERQPGGGGGHALGAGGDDGSGEYEAAPPQRPRTAGGGSATTPARPQSSSTGTRGSTAGAGLSATALLPGGATPSTGIRPPSSSGGPGAGLSQSTRLPALGGSGSPPSGGATASLIPRSTTPAGFGNGGGATGGLPGARSASPAPPHQWQTAVSGFGSSAGWQAAASGLVVGDGSFAEALLDLQADVDDLRLEVMTRMEGISGRLAALIERHGAAAVAPVVAATAASARLSIAATANAAAAAAAGSADVVTDTTPQ